LKRHAHLVDHARTLEEDLRERIVPRWARSIDPVGGGYRVRRLRAGLRDRVRVARARARRFASDALRGRPLGDPAKNLVFQSRVTWTLSHAHRGGYGDTTQAAEAGYRFLVDRLHDPRHGGFFWATDREGRVVDSRKALYGQAFAIYALVEYHRATGLDAPLERALAAFHAVHGALHDAVYGGWIEHGRADFAPLPGPPGTWGPVDRVGRKSANGHLHWMEALSELVSASGDPVVHAALEEVLEILANRFFPADPASCMPEATRDWKGLPVPDDVINYGHNLEFAWLMARARQALGWAADSERFDALVGHALRYAFDRREGGFHYSGPPRGPAIRREKMWWVQAEGLAALSVALRDPGYTPHSPALERLVRWIVTRQRRPDGEWHPMIDARGSPRSIVARQSWNAGYHQVRAAHLFLHALGPHR